MSGSDSRMARSSIPPSSPLSSSAACRMAASLRSFASWSRACFLKRMDGRPRWVAIWCWPIVGPTQLLRDWWLPIAGATKIGGVPPPRPTWSTLDRTRPHRVGPLSTSGWNSVHFGLELCPHRCGTRTCSSSSSLSDSSATICFILSSSETVLAAALSFDTSPFSPIWDRSGHDYIGGHNYVGGVPWMTVAMTIWEAITM